MDAQLVKATIRKYCAFLPYEIYFTDSAAPSPEDTKPLNNTMPLWMKPARECTDEEYKQFYRDVFHQADDPLFWIHLNVDSPFQLKSIIYFPRLRDERNLMDIGEIKLYYNRVFVADNIKEILPEFLMVLKGVIDCPDIPINVSRSFLQNDGTVSKIASFISKKVSDKLHSIFEASREEFERYWEDIRVLIEYGCLRDLKFYDRMKDIVLFARHRANTAPSRNGLATRSRRDKRVYYTDNRAQQTTAVGLYEEQGIPVAEFRHPIDLAFAQAMEMEDSSVRFISVTSQPPENLKTASRWRRGR